MSTAPSCPNHIYSICNAHKHTIPVDLWCMRIQWDSKWEQGKLHPEALITMINHAFIRIKTCFKFKIKATTFLETWMTKKPYLICVSRRKVGQPKYICIYELCNMNGIILVILYELNVLMFALKNIPQYKDECQNPCK